MNSSILSLLFLCILSTAYARCPKKVSFIIGSYTDQPWLPTSNGTGIVIASFQNRQLNTTAILPPSLTGRNPAYVAPASQYLYASNENDPVGTITQIQFQSRTPYISSISREIGGSAPVHIAVINNFNRRSAIKRFIITSNFNDASVSIFTKTRSSLNLVDKFRVPSKLATKNRNSAVSDQQAAPHPHMALEYKSGIVVPDLGSDIVWYLSINHRNGKLKEITRIKLADGDGPRHAAKHPHSNTVFVVNEISLTVAVLRPGCSRNKMLGLCNKVPLVWNMKEAEGATAAAIRVSRNGKFVYVSVRYPGVIEGTIVVFSTNRAGNLKKLNEFPAGGVHPRDFMIVEGVKVGSKCQSFIAVVNRDSNNLVMIRRNIETGKLLNNDKYSYSVNTPVSVSV